MQGAQHTDIILVELIICQFKYRPVGKVTRVRRPGKQEVRPCKNSIFHCSETLCERQGQGSHYVITRGFRESYNNKSKRWLEKKVLLTICLSINYKKYMVRWCPLLTLLKAHGFLYDTVIILSLCQSCIYGLHERVNVSSQITVIPAGCISHCSGIKQ